MNNVERCLWAINVIVKEYDNYSEETIQQLKDNFDIIFAEDDYFKKFHPTQYYLQKHYYEQELTRLMETEPIDEQQFLSHYSQLPDKWSQRDQVCALIKRLCKDGNPEKAKEYTSLLDADLQYQGFRIILEYYAEQGDLKNFQSILKDAKPRESPMNDVEGSKNILIENYTRAHGLESGLELCKKKIFGDKYIYFALLAVIEGYITTQKLLESKPELKQAFPNLYERILVQAYIIDVDIHKDEDIFNEIFNILDKMDPKVKWGDFRLRDGLLLDLGTSLQNDDEKKYKKRILQCRKAIKNNFLKGELNK